jgi:hypothetical protein
MELRKFPHPEVPREARPRRTHGAVPADREFNHKLRGVGRPAGQELAMTLFAQRVSF